MENLVNEVFEMDIETGLMEEVETGRVGGVVTMRLRYRTGSGEAEPTQSPRYTFSAQGAAQFAQKLAEAAQEALAVKYSGPKH